MKLLKRQLWIYRSAVAAAILIKLFATMFELLLPYILEHIIDDVVPQGQMRAVIGWGALMFLAAFVCRMLNVLANRTAVNNAHRISFDVRQALFAKTVNLSGSQFDTYTLPSLISRMTSDSYNVQSAVQQFQTLFVRAPIMLFGGLLVALTMDWQLAMIPRVQERLDAVVRIMRENITGIRVVKALCKEDYEQEHFAAANQAMTRQDIAASTVMAIPGPFMQLCLNVGLTLVVLFGAGRVNAGEIKPGVILAFLTYFNMIAMGVMGLNRIFMTLSRASASADRIDAVLQTQTDQTVLSGTEAARPSGEGFIRFEDVGFRYGEGEGGGAGFAGEKREKALDRISFSIPRGGSLGIIGPTGCGKTTIINLLMRFYDASEGHVFVDGRDVRSYDKDTLRRRFGAVFQNDMIFRDSLRENIAFGRELSDEAVRAAVEDAMAAEFVDALDEGLD